MKLVEHNCANCGAVLYKIGDTEFRCDYCESTYMLKKSGTLKKQKKPKESKSVVLKSQNLNPQVSKGQDAKARIAKANQRWSKNATWEKGSFAETFFAIVAVLWFGAMIILGFVGLVMLIQVFTGERTIGQENEIVIEQNDYGVSEDFIKVAEAVFEKPYEQISQSEFDSVSKVYVDFWAGDCISEGYFIVDGEQRDFRCEADFIELFYDLNTLRNLRAFSTDCPILEGVLDGFDKLTEIETDCTVLELLEVLPNPEQITVLKGVTLRESTDGLTDFSNLKVLHVEVEGVKDLGALEELTGLEEIRIDSADNLKGFDVLAKLTKLKKVSINSWDLYSLEFARSLPNLESLIIETDCDVESIDALAGKSTLKELIIGECSSIWDFSALNKLPNLEVLSVNGNKMGGEVEWSRLAKLTKLSFSSFDEENLINELPQMQQLTELELSNSMSENVGYHIKQVGTLKNLKVLTLGAVGYGDFSGLTGLAELETLNMSYVKGSGIEKLFELPKLKEFTLFDCELDVNFEVIAKNNTLEKLSIKYCDFLNNYQEVLDGYFTYVDYEQVELSDKIDFVRNLQGLRELTIRGTRLNNVDFVADLPSLIMLDVTNNYVSDVSGVNECQALSELWIGDNAISVAPEFNHPVTVHMDGESNWRYEKIE